MRNPDRDSQRSRAAAIAAGMRWATTISAVAFEMALPPVLGAWLDERFGTTPVLMAVLAALGMLVAMMHLRQLVKMQSPGGPGEKRPNESRRWSEDSGRGGPSS